jgi:hypothetical protein
MGTDRNALKLWRGGYCEAIAVAGLVGDNKSGETK